MQKPHRGAGALYQTIWFKVILNVCMFVWTLTTCATKAIIWLEEALAEKI